MKKKLRKNPIEISNSVEAAAAVNRGQVMIKRIAIGFASIIGVTALYYCLIPALTQNGDPDSLYVFFDNGLSQYEGKTNDDGTTTVVTGEVYGSADGTAEQKLTMRCLSDVILDSDQTLWNAVKGQLGSNVEAAVAADGKVILTNADNVNPENVYVSTEAVIVGKYVSFTGWDSGTVYDTVTNYRVNSASREWGYDYHDFQWTSDPTQLEIGKTCYYAPPQLMINRYSAVAATTDDGTPALVQLIYEHGDTKEDASSKPEVTGSWVNPQNAEGREFWDAQFKMEGAFGDVKEDNKLGNGSQSYKTENNEYVTLEGSVSLGGDGDNGLGTSNKQYHATATFFDYFSDWELAGNPLSVHDIAYTYINADGNDVKPIWSMSADYDTPVTITENFPAEDFGGFENAGAGSLSVRTDAGYGCADDNTYYLQLFSGAVAEYTLPADATGNYYSASMWVRNATNGEKTISVSLYYQLGDAVHTVALNEMRVTGWDADGGVWTELKSGSFYLPDGAKNASLRYSSGNETFRLDDFTLKYEGTGTDTGTATQFVDVAKLGFPSGDLGGFKWIDNTALDKDKLETSNDGDAGNHGTHSGDHTMYAYYAATASYPITSGAGNYKFSIFVTPSHYGLSYVTASLHYTLNGTATEEQVIMYTLPDVTDDGGNEQNKNKGTWYEIADSFSVPDGASDVELRFRPYNIGANETYDEDTHGTATYFLDDFTLQHEETATGAATEYVTIASADFTSGGEPEDYGFDTVDVEGDNNGNLSIDNQRLYSFYHQPAVYTLPSDLIKAGNYKFSIQITDTKWQLRNAAAWLSTDGGQSGVSLTSISINKNENADPTGKWYTLEGQFTVPENAASVQLYFQTFDAWWENWESSMYTDSAYYDNFTLQYETAITDTGTDTGTAAGTVTGDVTTSYTRNDSIAKDYADYVGVTLFSSVDDAGVTLPSEDDVISFKGAKLYVCATADGENKIPLQGENTYSNKDLYLLEGTAYATAEVQVIAQHYASQTSCDMQVGEDELLGEYEAGMIHISENFSPPIGAGSTVIIIRTEDGSDIIIDDLDIGLDLIDIEGSFSEGSNTIAYSYQGSLFNDAISKYYKDALGANTADTIVPLYFGSNSWMTGNGRYFNADRHGQALFNADQIAAALGETDGAVYTITQSTVGNSPVDILDDEGENPGSGAYIQPYSRQYWNTLFGFTAANDNSSHGFSNSRAVEGLVTYHDSKLKVNVAGTDNPDNYIEAPYFNSAFLKGDNEANAAYGEVYSDVDFAFAYNEDTGYYEYDSTRAWYATRLTEKSGGGYYMDYYNYDQLVTHSADGVTYADDAALAYQGVKKADTNYKDGNGTSQTIYQFYPFNTPDTNDRFATENLMFGMKLDIPFNMYANEEKRNNSMFKFSGDDDVWVYVDDKPVLDIGGTHTAVGGFIDLKNGYGVVGSSFTDYTGYYKEVAGLGLTELVTGEDEGISNVEKAAFALLASENEIAPSSDWQKTAEVNFFDDTFKAASDCFKQNTTNVMQYQYSIRTIEGTNEKVIDVKFRNAMAASKDTSKIKVLKDDDLTAEVTAAQAADPTVNPYGLAEGAKCYIVTQADVETAYRLWKNKAANYTVTSENIQDALEDGIIHPVGTVLPKDFVVYGDTGLTNHLGYPTINGNVTFDLTEFHLDTTDESADLSDHKLTIYYMERGLNSSNFKLAFNFIPNAQREVEKVWADSNEKHQNQTDYVDVELWRTEPENGDTAFTFPENYALVRAIAHQSKSDSGTATSKFVEDNDEVTVQYKMNDSGVDSAATLTLNSMVLSLEAYRQLNASSLGMTVYLNDVPVSLNTIEADAADDDDGDGNKLDPGEFYNPAAEDAKFVVSRADHDNYATGGEYDYTAIKLPAEETVIKIVFKAKADNVATNADYNTWGFITSNVWLVEAYGYNRTNDTEIAVSDQTVLSNLTQDILAVSGEASVTLQASDMVIAVINAARAHSYKDANNDTQLTGYYANNYAAYAVASDMSLDAQYTYSGDRTVDVWNGTWNGAFTDVEYTQVYNDKTVTANTSFSVSLKTAANTENKVYAARLSCAKPYDNIGTGISYASIVEAVTYSAPVKIGTTERLNNASGWEKLWDNIVESVTLDGETYNYRYFIREVDAYSTNFNNNNNYETLYYDSTGNPITPTVITVNGSDLTLYSIDIKNADGRGYVKIVNTPVTNATIDKEWAVKEEGDKINIVVTLYGEDSTKPGVVTVVDKILLSSANNYTASIESLPLFNPVTHGAMTYYASEDISAKYKASYSTDGVNKTLGAAQITVYPLNTPGEGKAGTLSLSIINQVEGFVLEINKIDEEDNTPLKGAEFVLYEWDEELKDWAAVTKTLSSTEAEEAESASLESASALMNVVGNANVSLANAQQILTAADNTISSDVYYNFSLSTNPHADYFTIGGGTNTASGSASYNGLTLSTALKMGSGQSITFTVSGACKVTLVATKNGDSGGLKITKDGIDVDSCTVSDSVTAYELSIPGEGTYIIQRDGGQHYLYYIDLDFSATTTTTSSGSSSGTTTTTTKYNKYDAESFMDALSEADSWFSSTEGIQLANDLVDLQLTDPSWGWGLGYSTDYGNGGWQKDPDYYTDSGSDWYRATIDNNVTTAHIRYLARAYRVTGNEQYKKSVIKGIECLLNYQYDNGGWPQVFALNEDGQSNYHCLITYNDGAITKVLELLREIRDKSGDFAAADLIDDTTASNAGKALQKGVKCILDTQIEVNGTLTAWCQQHDEDTLEASAGRAHELASISAGESKGIVDFLQSILTDTEIVTNSTFTKNDIIVAINAAVQWYKDAAIYGYVLENNRIPIAGTNDDAIWSRFYAITEMTAADGTKIEVNDPFFVQRDDNVITIHADFNKMPAAQQTSYQWYGTWGKPFLNMASISTDTDLKGTIISNVHVYDISRFSGWQMGTDLQVGSFVFGDRDFTYVTLPSELLGAEYVKTACDSKNFTDDLAALTAAVNMDVYIAIDNRVVTVPSWLSDWEKTESTALTSNNVTFNIYKKSMTTGETVTLGANGQISGCIGYTIMAVAQSTEGDSETKPIVPEDAMVYTTDANGRVLIGGLQPGRYRLIEVKAPIGYAPYTDDIEFTVSSNDEGAIRTDVIDYTSSEFVTFEWSDEKELTLVATIKNEYCAIIIPNTGGTGAYSVFIGGAVFIIAAFAGVLLVHKRSKRPE